MKERKKIHRLKGVTLTEVLVAMALLGIILTFTMIVSERVFVESPQWYSIEAEALADEVLTELKAKRTFIDFEETKGDFNVSGVFSAYSNGANLLVLELAISDKTSGTLILNEKHLIQSDEE